MKYLIKSIFLILSVTLLSFVWIRHKPVLYIIGDSTVKNGDGKGKNAQWGWGTVIDAYFDTGKISVRNLAIGGRSSRTFITDGRWDKILETVTKGDYVIMQFGHNDSSPLDDTARARGTIRGTGNDSIEIYNPIRKRKEMVHSYGYYMRRFVNETKAKGATPIICSPVPRNSRKDGRTIRNDYRTWAKQVADETAACYIDLQDMIATKYDKMDTTTVNLFFPADHTHTNKEGAVLNAGQVVAGIKQLRKCHLKKFLLDK